MQNLDLWGDVSHPLQKQHETVFLVVKSYNTGGSIHTYIYIYYFIYDMHVYMYIRVRVCGCVFVGVSVHAYVHSHIYHMFTI